MKNPTFNMQAELHAKADVRENQVREVWPTRHSPSYPSDHPATCGPETRTPKIPSSLNIRKKMPYAESRTQSEQKTKTATPSGTRGATLRISSIAGGSSTHGSSGCANRSADSLGLPGPLPASTKCRSMLINWSWITTRTPVS